MKKTFLKDTFREIRKTRGRFIAIAAIVALGTAFFVGIKTTCPDMKLTADTYYKEQHFMDFRLASNVGFDDADISTLKNDKDIKGVMPSYSVDAVSTIGNKEKVLRILSLPTDLLASNENYINRPKLINGRLPEKTGECVIEKNKLSSVTLNVGDKIKLSSGDESKLSDKLTNDKYTIVGIVNSPLYVSTDRGTSSLGNGQVSAFVEIPEIDFKLKYYSSVYLTTNVNSTVQAYSTAYDDSLGPVRSKLETLSTQRENIRYAGIKSDAGNAFNDQNLQYRSSVNDANTKLTDAYKKINDSQAQIDSGKAQLAQIKIQTQKSLADAQSQINQGQITFKQANADYQTKLNAYTNSVNDADAKLADAYKKINDTQIQIDSGKTQFVQSKIQAQKSLADAQNQINQSQMVLNQAKGGYQAKLDMFNAQKQKAILDGIYIAQKAAFDKNQAQLNASNLQIVKNQAQLVSKQQQLNSSKDTAQKEFSDKQAQIDNAQTVLNKSKKDYEQNKADTDKKLAVAKQQLDDGKTQIDNNKTQLSSKQQQLNSSVGTAQKEFSDKQAQIDNAQTVLNKSKSDYEQNKADIDKKLAVAKQQLDEGKAQINSIPKVNWSVLDRNTNIGYLNYKNAADRMNSMAQVFPIIFILVAILICFTSMSRMVEEQRSYMGTMKALGYSKVTIAAKFLLYSILASIVGGFIGLVVGFSTFPTLLSKTNSILYTLPKLILTINLPFAAISIIVGVGVTSFAALIVCIQELNSNAATLMRPRAPKAGKKILLERVPFIWNRLKFTQKLIARNLFRYKSRFFMTVIGVGGCTALLLVGFGFNDAIRTIGDKQFGQIDTYQVNVNIKNTASTDETANIKNTINKQINLSSVENLLSGDIEIGLNNNEESCNLIVPDNPGNINKFINLRVRTTGKQIPLSNSGVVLTEKLATMIGAKIGNNVYIKNGGTKKFTVKVTGIAENYLQNYAYMSPTLYKNLYNKTPDFNEMNINLKNNDASAEQTFSANIVSLNGVASVNLMSDSMQKFKDTIKSTYNIVIILIVSAGLLSFIVLFTLTNININERMREIATIKVLGFYNNEVSAYVFRENLILTFIGACVGLIIGSPLTRYIISSAEVDNIMFGRQIYPLSFILATVITLVFALFVDMMMLKRIKNINMVEALKSVE